MASTALSRFRLILWILVLVVGVGASLLYFVRPPERPQTAVTGGEFALASTKGGTFTQEDLRGTPSLVFFGYTYCPDVCPTTLAESIGWAQELELSADRLRVIFVSVDPERDTLEHLDTYVSAFSEDLIGLTGTPEEVTRAKAAFGVYSEKVDDAASTEYLVNHTASVFLLNADGAFEGTIAYGEARDTALGKIRRLVGL